jgi:hypothetical protein
MGLSEITREAVIAAIAEYTSLGKMQFLKQYGYQDARRYFLLFQNQEFPSKAIAGVAYKYVNSGNKALTYDDFSGGMDTVVKKLSDLGFYIIDKNKDDTAHQKTLIRYKDYSREMVHDIFSPETRFTPQTGTWGIHGIIPVPDQDGDFVFFVTLGQQQGEHIFDEGITDNGVLSWQSQPRQSLKNSQIQQFINHDELKNNIYLFFRTSGRKNYTYFGKIKYLSHDKDREFPVYFQWQILDWEPGDNPEKIGLKLQITTNKEKDISPVKINYLEFVDPPKNLKREGISTPTFKSKKNPDYSERDARNRALGFNGEMLVLKTEKEALINCGKLELAEKIRHISEILGDGTGFDIESFTQEGVVKYIEVKTTTGSMLTPFFMSSNEKAFAELKQENYYLYRVFDYDTTNNSGKYYILHGDLENTLNFSPTQYRVSFLPPND